ncbi:hypothetical protein EDB80DRAFT_410124 [Ilyonectria destructans]|nr:hypothetical protein EDB80DRAFT_410124 [Ilyonectria destructans]
MAGSLGAGGHINRQAERNEPTSGQSRQPAAESAQGHINQSKEKPRKKKLATQEKPEARTPVPRKKRKKRIKTPERQKRQGIRNQKPGKSNEVSRKRQSQKATNPNASKPPRTPKTRTLINKMQANAEERREIRIPTAKSKKPGDAETSRTPGNAKTQNAGNEKAANPKEERPGNASNASKRQ